VTGLFPVLAAAVEVVRGENDLWYRVRVGGGGYTVTADRMLHVLGQTTDGIVGLSPLKYSAETMGIAIALDQFAAKFFANGGVVSGILTTPLMDDDAMNAFKAAWREEYSGSGAAHKIAPLPPDYKFQPLTVEPEKSQALQSRTNQVLEIARIYQVPPHMLGVMDKASYASIEQTTMSFYQDTVRPWCTRIEAELERKALAEADKPRLQIRHNMDAVLRATTNERYQAHATAINAGFMTVNEARAKENLPPVAGGDTLRVPLNMAELGRNDDQARLGFLRETVRAFIADGTVADVIANGTDLGRLVSESGLPANAEYQEPYLPVLADPGLPVTGEVLKDDAGDVVGGVATSSPAP
jgi:HK97 family phage portal protein